MEYLLKLPDDIIREIISYDGDKMYWCKRTGTPRGKFSENDARKKLLTNWCIDFNRFMRISMRKTKQYDNCKGLVYVFQFETSTLSVVQPNSAVINRTVQKEVYAQHVTYSMKTTREIQYTTHISYGESEQSINC